jgi:hypothetical protein
VSDTLCSFTLRPYQRIDMLVCRLKLYLHDTSCDKHFKLLKTKSNAFHQRSTIKKTSLATDKAIAVSFRRLLVLDPVMQSAACT